MTANDCLFCKIVNGEIPADIIHQSATTIAFRDINPQAPTHLLVIPKREIVSLADLSEEDEAVMGRCMVVVQKVAAQEGLDGGYRLICNCGDDGGQEVPHIHFHVLGGRKLTWPPG